MEGTRGFQMSSYGISRQEKTIKKDGHIQSEQFHHRNLMAKTMQQQKSQYNIHRTHKKFQLSRKFPFIDYHTKCISGRSTK